MRPSVQLSVRPIRPPHAAAASLLLRAPAAGDMDRLLHARRSAAAALQRSSKCEQYPSLYPHACDDPSGGRRTTAQIPQLDTPQPSNESHNSIHSQTNYGRTEGLLFGRLVADCNFSVTLTQFVVALCTGYFGALACNLAKYSPI